MACCLGSWKIQECWRDHDAISLRKGTLIGHPLLRKYLSPATWLLTPAGVHN